MERAGECARWAPIAMRLATGQPISMAVIGSSISGVSGGCTRGVPGVCDDSQCPLCCGTACGVWGNRGWARDVLEMVNKSWPHVLHTLYNLGQPGGGLAEVIVSCLRDYFSFRVDVFLLELAIIGGKKANVLELVDALVLDQHARFGHVPLIMFTSFDFVFADVSEYTPLNGNRTPGTYHGPAWAERRDTIEQLASRWGWPLFSTEGFRRLPLATRLAAWEPDFKHPLATPHGAGRRLIATPIYEAFRDGVRRCHARGGVQAEGSRAEAPQPPLPPPGHTPRWQEPSEAVMALPSSRAKPPAAWQCLQFGRGKCDPSQRNCKAPPLNTSVFRVLESVGWAEVRTPRRRVLSFRREALAVLDLSSPVTRVRSAGDHGERLAHEVQARAALGRKGREAARCAWRRGCGRAELCRAPRVPSLVRDVREGAARVREAMRVRCERTLGGRQGRARLGEYEL